MKFQIKKRNWSDFQVIWFRFTYRTVSNKIKKEKLIRLVWKVNRKSKQFERILIKKRRKLLNNSLNLEFKDSISLL